MTATLGMWNHPEKTEQTLQRPAPMHSSNGTSDGGSSADAATISANDFLTLLVTEMQNQDPTATTDPNEYINQLVNVNSLEQLISINQNLSTALGISVTNSSQTSGQAGIENMGRPAAQTDAPATSVTGSATASSTLPVTHKFDAAEVASGNLTAPSANPAALRVAHALGGRL